MLGASLVIVGLIAILSYRSGEAARVAEQERKSAEGIVRVSALLLSTLKDAETGQRGFLLTGREDYLAPYNQAVAAMPGILDRFRTATASQPDLARQVQNIERLAGQKLAVLKATIELCRANQPAAALAMVDTNRGETYMAEIRASGGEVEQTALARLEGFEANAGASAANLSSVSIGGSLLLGVFLALATITIFRGLDLRDALLRQAFAGEKLLATTLAGIADAVIATDAQGRITFINPAARDLTGWSEREASGAPIQQVFAIVNETTRLKVDNPVEKALQQAIPMGLANHTNLISKSGQDIPIDDSAAPLRDEQGNTVGAVLVFRDISARRRAETQLRSANQELQQFVDTAAHDLHAPLNSVNAMAQMLAARYTRELGAEGQELIGYVTAGLERMRKLLDDLLDFARASHFDETTAEAIPLDGPFQAALQNLKPEIERTAATVTCDPLPVAAIHEAHALQLFQNLLGNALKYHGQDPPRIHVRAAGHDGEFQIAMTDNGMGIEPEYLEQIFKPFKRLHGDAYPGSGIGLAACQKIVNGYGGRIWAESAPGKGSTFYVALPGTESAPDRPARS